MIARRPATAVAVVAWGLAALSVSLAATTAALAVVNRGSIRSFDGASPIEIVLPLSFALVGGLVASQRRENPIGWLFLFMALVTGLGGATYQYGFLAATAHPATPPGAVWALWWSSWSETLVYPSGAAAIMLLLLPDGHLPSRRWWLVVVAAVAFTLVLTIPFSALTPGRLGGPNGLPPHLVNPVGVSGLQGIAPEIANVSFVVGLGILLLAAAAPMVRTRRARGEEREQLRWIAYVVLTTVAVDFLQVAISFVALSPLLEWTFTATNLLGFGVGLPVAAGVAIFKYRLYDIDVIIGRTLVYGSLAAFITAVYVAVAVGVGSLVGTGGQPNLGLSVLATAIVAVGFQPVRSRLNRVANRLVYGRRATPYEVLSQFSERVSESYAAHDVLPRMARVLAEGTGAEQAQVWLRAGDLLRPAASWPDLPDPDGAAGKVLAVVGQILPAIPESDRAAAVRQQGELLGALTVRKRTGEPLTPIEIKLLEDLANQAGPVLKNVGLTAELLQRLDELRASRQRLVVAQDAERRRLERNLHDGAQQNLVALKVKAGLAKALARKDPAKAEELVGQIAADADEALHTLRDLARGIYPPLLADRGLGAAVEAQAGRATLPVVVEAEGVARYPQEVEAAVYFCVLEALQNVQKYAGASHATIRLSHLEAKLAFTVEDDGHGFDPSTTRRGSGLTNIADRLDALGGGLEVTSGPGTGTRLTGSVPSSPVEPGQGEARLAPTTHRSGAPT